MYDIAASIVVYNNPHAQLSEAISSFLNTALHVHLYIIDNSADCHALHCLRRSPHHIHFQRPQPRLWRCSQYCSALLYRHMPAITSFLIPTSILALKFYRSFSTSLLPIRKLACSCPKFFIPTVPFSISANSFPLPRIFSFAVFFRNLSSILSRIASTAMSSAIATTTRSYPFPFSPAVS